MRKTIPLILLLILSGIAPAFPVRAQSEPSGAWDNRYSYTVDYGNGTQKSTFSIGPQVFWSGSDWQELKFEDLGDGFLLENSMITAYIYEWYAVFFDPDNQRVAVDDERWIVEVYNEKTKKWREVDLYGPSLSYSNNATHLTVTRSFDCAEGEFNVTYILWQGGRLKHDISFRSGMEGSQQFRVTMKLTGIYSDKVKHSAGSETITSEKHVISPFFVFGEDNNNLVFSEYLWKLGEINETTGEWTPTTLKDVILDTSAKGSKMDIIIGNYTLAENESLLIDPDSDTWYVGAGTDDCYVYGSTMRSDRVYLYINHASYTMILGVRFTNVAIPKESDITSAYLKLHGYGGGSDGDYETDIEGFKEANTATFSTAADLNGRSITTASVIWSGSWVRTEEHTSPDIGGIIEEIVAQGGWSSGNALGLKLTDTDVYTSGISADSYEGTPAPYLEVTWEAGIGGEEYSRFVSQSISWSGLTYRLCTFNRDSSQSVSMVTDSHRTWSLSRNIVQDLTFAFNSFADLLELIQRTASLALSLISDSSRGWNIVRIFYQDLTMTSNGNRIISSVRTAYQGLTTSLSSDRTWDTARIASQTITFSSNVLTDLMSIIQRTASLVIDLASSGERTWGVVRGAYQSLYLTTNALAQLIAAGVEEFYRTVNMGLSFTTNMIRKWSLTRSVGQSISLASIADFSIDDFNEDGAPAYQITIYQPPSTDDDPQPANNNDLTSLIIIMGGSVITYWLKKQGKLS